MTGNPLSPTPGDLRRHFADKLERATLQLERAVRETERNPLARMAWASEAFWRGVQVAWQEALEALDGIPQDEG